MKILYCYNEDWERDFVTERLTGHELVFVKGTLQEQHELPADAEALSLFVNSSASAELLGKLPALKLIATRSTGYDHIDTNYAKEKGIAVAYVPTYGENTVAEFAFALLLSLSRKICDAYDQVRTTGSFSQLELRGLDLKGKTIGIVGTGHIGMHAIAMARGFDMRILAYDVKENAEAAGRLGFNYLPFEELLAQSDILSLHAPYNERTHHMINRESIKKMKRGSILINTARGGLVESEALVAALEDGTVAGAGLDVLEGEGFMDNEVALLASEAPQVEDLKRALANQYFIDHPRVIVTPHNAYNTREAIERILGTTCENIVSFAQSRPIHLIP